MKMIWCHANLPTWTILVCIFLLGVRLSTSKSLTSPETLEKGVEEQVISFVCPKDGKFPHELYCEKYYDCKQSVATVMNCVTSLDFLFNDNDSMCDRAFSVHCGARIRPEGVTNTRFPPSTTTPIPLTTTKIPTTTTRAPTTTPKTTTTQHTTTLITIPTTIPPPSDFYNCTENGAFPHSKYCEMYFDCWEGVSTLLKCPNDTLFDVQPEYSGCGPPKEVECGSRIRPCPSVFQCPVDGKDGEIYPDPHDCAWYYTCTNNMPIHMECPQGLFFNKYLTVCDHPANVDCSDRQRCQIT